MSSVHYVYADSINRSPEQSGNSYTLNLTSELRNIEKVELLSASIPHVAYNITDGTNIITVNGVSYSIPSGFYTATALASFTSNVIGVGVDYLKDQGIFVFHQTLAFTVSFNTDELRLRMGFKSGTLNSVDSALTLYGSQYASQNILYSTSIVDLSTTKFVFLDIDELRNDSLVDSKIIGPTGTYTGTTVARTFAAIPMDIIPDWACTKVFKKDYEYYIKYEVPLARLNRLTIRWLDYNGQLLNFNGMERNCFLLRVFCKPSAPPPEEKETDEDLLVQKMQRMIDDAFPPPKPKKSLWRWWLLFIPVLIGILAVLKR